MPYHRFGFAIIGCGRVADRRVAPAIRRAEGAELIGMCSRDLMRAAEFVGRHNARRAYGSIEEVLSDNDVHAVYIATPNNLHAEHAIACLRGGKHVVIDKPIAMNLVEAERVHRAAEEAGRSVTVMHQQRFHPANLHLIRMLDERKLGTLRFARARIGIWYSDAENWRLNKSVSGGGAAMDLGPHVLDVLLQVGGPVRRVHAFTANLCFDYPVEDFCHAQLEFNSGLQALVEMSYCERTYGGRLEAYGSNGSYIVDGSLQQASYFHTHLRIGEPADAADVEEAVYRNSFVDAIEDITDAFRSGNAPMVTVYDGMEVISVIEAIYQSARTGSIVDVQPVGNPSTQRRAMT